MSSTVEQSDLHWLDERVESAFADLAALASRCALTEALRATAWRLFLGLVRPDEPATWPTAVAAQRERYVGMRARAMARLEEAMRQAIRPEEEEEATKDASDGEHSLAELEDAADQIRADLERCYPEGAGSHFVEPRRQKMMFHILLVWSNEHARPGYRQGMHELLAPLVWTLERSFAATSLVVLPPGSALHPVRVDLRYLEEDAYWLFDAVATLFLPLYDPDAKADSAGSGRLLLRPPPQCANNRGGADDDDVADDHGGESTCSDDDAGDGSTGSTPPGDHHAAPAAAAPEAESSEPRDADPAATSFVVAMCARVQNSRLATVDADLHAHLSRFGDETSTGRPDAVLPQVYMLSWLRLGFARQTTITDTCKLWDAFFATSGRPPPLGGASLPESCVSRSRRRRPTTTPADPAGAPEGVAPTAPPSLVEWLEHAATVLIVLERTRLLRVDTGVGCLRVLLRVVAPEPSYLVRHARRLHADPAAIQPLVAALRQHAHLAHVFPAWLVALLGSLGVVAAPPKTSLLARDAGVSNGAGGASDHMLPSSAASSYFSGVFSATVLGRVLALVDISPRRPHTRGVGLPVVVPVASVTLTSLCGCRRRRDPPPPPRRATITPGSAVRPVFEALRRGVE